MLAAPGRRAGSGGAGQAGSDAATGDSGGRAMSAIAPVLEGRNLTKHFWLKRGPGPFGRRLPVNAVDNVSVRLDAGKVTALVGESGAGKTTVGRLLAKIIKPDAGSIL